MVRAQNLLHWGHLLLKRFTRKMIRAKNKNIGKQHQHPVGIEEKKPAAAEGVLSSRSSVVRSSSP
jgi:hypothetical protein